MLVAVVAQPVRLYHRRDIALSLARTLYSHQLSLRFAQVLAREQYCTLT